MEISFTPVQPIPQLESGIWLQASPTCLTLGVLLDKISGHTRSVEDILIAPDGKSLYSCSSDTTVRKWDLVTGDELERYEGHDTSVYGMTAAFDDDALWTGIYLFLYLVSGDKTAIRWDLGVSYQI